jgi:phosphatidylglycerophosphate synthase
MVAVCEQDRIELSDAFAAAQRELHVADRVVAAAQRLARHKAILGMMAAGLVLAPVMARKWIRRASWWLPILIQGYRIIRQSSQPKRRTRPRSDDASATE